MAPPDTPPNSPANPPSDSPRTESVARRPDDPASREAWLTAGLSAGLFIAVLAVFVRVIGFGFLTLDDGVYVYENPFVLRGLTTEGFRWAFTAVHANYWLPLTWLSFMLDASLFGPRPTGFHTTNLILHGLNTSLLFLFLRRATLPVGYALFVAAVFAFHPTRLETVAWITSRKDLLSTLFGLVALLAYLRYARKDSWGAYAAVLGAFLASLLCKVAWIALPLLLILLDLWPLGRRAPSAGVPNCSWKRLALEKLPLFALSASAVLWTARLHPLASVPPDTGSALLRMLQAGANYAHYLGMACVPRDVNLGATTGSVPVWIAAASWLILGAITVFVLKLSRQPWLKVGWFWFLIALAPVVGLINNGGTEIADRFLYVPLIGIALALGGWLENFRSQSDSRTLVARWIPWILAATLVGVTTLRLPLWKDSATRFTSILAKHPDNAKAWNALGLAKELQGERQSALADYEQALKANPGLTHAAVNRANALAGLGRMQEAADQLLATVDADPKNARLKSNLGVCLFSLERHEEGLRNMREALAIDPYLLDTRYNLALALVARGDHIEARKTLETLLALNPDDRAARDLLRTLHNP